MPTAKITKRVVDALTPGDRDMFLWDDGLKGFGLKCTPRGRKVFLIQYRTVARGASSKRYTIGPYGSPWTPALEALSKLSRLGNGPYVFPAYRGDGHFIGLQKIWEKIRKGAGLDDVRIHDLRHSFASVSATGGDTLLMLGAILGHKNQAATQRYAHPRDDPIKAAAERTSATIDAAMKGADATVIQLKRPSR